MTDSFQEESYEEKCVTLETEMKDILLALGRNKTPRADRAPVELLQSTGTELVKMLTRMKCEKKLFSPVLSCRPQQQNNFSLFSSTKAWHFRGPKPADDFFQQFHVDSEEHEYSTELPPGVTAMALSSCLPAPPSSTTWLARPARSGLWKKRKQSTQDEDAVSVCSFESSEEPEYTCTKCKLVFKLVPLLEEKVKGLEDDITSLWEIRGGEQFLDIAQEVLQASQRQPPSRQNKEKGATRESAGEMWRHVTLRRRQHHDLHLHTLIFP
ncbi:WD repeat-containing protein 76 [Varanus komodoensis]|nr:WD repeat-containing protein 76 [Varanus komodoensis]